MESWNVLVKQHCTDSSLLSVQCNTLHGTEYKITCSVCLCVCARARVWGPNISKMVGDGGTVPMGHQ